MTGLMWFAISMALLMSATSLVLTLVLIRIITKQDTTGRAEKLDRQMQELEDRLAENMRATGQANSYDDNSGHSTPDGVVCMPLSDEIIRLRDNDLDNVEIARRLDINVGEVELVLGLQRCSGRW